ncbi:MAG: helix-turn-helix domain-containing protein [Candidatus Solibacter sp.]
MRYREFAPGEDASRLIECYWVLEGDASGVQRVVPDGRAELILNLAQPFEALENGAWQSQPRCFLAGQLTGPLMLRGAGPARIIGVRFRPGGVGQLLGMPVQELTGQTVSAEALGLRGLDGICTLPEVEAAILRQERGDTDPMVDAAALLLSLLPDVGAAAQSLGVSTRQLERRFRTRIGMSPKHFGRIARFQRVFRAVEEGGAGWVDAAAECGYYDQAHLIRDFRDLAGEAPTHLLASDDLARHFMSHLSKTRSAAHG